MYIVNGYDRIMIVIDELYRRLVKILFLSIFMFIQSNL